MVKISIKRKIIASIIILAAVFVVIFSLNFEVLAALLFGPTTSETFEVRFKWDNEVKSMKVIRVSTGKEEPWGVARLVVEAEARKAIPAAVSFFDLTRAEGKIYCSTVPDTLTALCLGPGFESRNIIDPDAVTPLMRAVAARDAASVKNLLANGADPNSADQYGRTLLMNAVNNEDLEIVEILLKADADPNVNAKKHFTALEIAAGGNTEIMKFLLRNGANVDFSGTDEQTPLFTAALANRVENAKLLLAAGANPNATRIDGQTPLMEAARHGALDVARILIRAGANLDARNKYGDTALSLATSQGYSELASLLRRAGASQ